MIKIGIGICTYCREEMFKKTLQSIVQNLPTDYEVEVVVVNDGTPYPDSSYVGANHVIRHTENRGIGTAKNSALKYLQTKECDFYFLIEDDQLILNSSIYSKYIEMSKVTNIQHAMDPTHGPANKPNGILTPRLTVNYTPDVGISLYPNCVGSFTFFTKYAIEKIGLFDERYKNGSEHLDHTYLAYLKKLTTPFWWFCSIKDPQKYICEQACSEVNSVIRPRADWQKNIIKGNKIFKAAYGYIPVEIPDTPQGEVIKFLKQLKK